VSGRSFLAPLLTPSATAYVLRNTRTRRIVASTLETAFDSETRKKGLLGREGLPAGHALIIAPTNLVHTFFMRFALDLLFVRRNGTVAKVRSSVPARRIVGALRGYAVIEMAAGELSRSETRPGDTLEVVAG
jgi:uncharacterized membrane protein (UPF0127 family)